MGWHPRASGWDQRMCQHRHNALYGSIIRARQTLEHASSEPTLSDKAQEIANRIMTNAGADLLALEKEIYTHRRNVDGKVVQIHHGPRRAEAKPKIRRGKGSY
jgi:hypothetical protein